MKVLHLVNWYPSPLEPLNGIFIKEYVENLRPVLQQKVAHIQAEFSDNLFKMDMYRISESETALRVKSRLCKGRLAEYLTLLFLVLTRLSLGRKWWDIVNVHIAIPLARYPRLLRTLFGRDIIITEHWSAYSYDFNLQDGSKAKRRLQKIFHHDIPVIAVSRALADEIRRFCDTDAFRTFVIPNIIRPEIFNYRPCSKGKTDPTTFLIAATWDPIKRPFLILEAFHALCKDRNDVVLRIVGEGEQLEAMKQFLKDRGLQDRVTFLGRLAKPEISREMQQADCFLHASKYETFSIVCAEALFCGTPVIASKIPAIAEFVNQSNGLFTENTVDDWYRALLRFMESKDGFDRERISRRAIERFRPDRVREQVLEAYRWTKEHNAGQAR